MAFTRPELVLYARFDIAGVERIPNRGPAIIVAQPPQLLRHHRDGDAVLEGGPARALPRQERGLRRPRRGSGREGVRWHPRRSRHRLGRAVEGSGRRARRGRPRGDHAAGHHPARPGVLRSGAQGSLGSSPPRAHHARAGDPRRGVGHREGVAAQRAAAERVERDEPAHDPRARRSCCRAQVQERRQGHRADHGGDHGVAARRSARSSTSQPRRSSASRIRRATRATRRARRRGGPAPTSRARPPARRSVAETTLRQENQ